MTDVTALKKQHLDNYKKAVLEIVTNNTSSLVNEDIMSLMKTPPLDSMDLVKTKLLTLAKKNKIILNTENLTKLINNYRKNLMSEFLDIGNNRLKQLKNEVEKFNPQKESDIIKIQKKTLNDINGKIKKEAKEKIKVISTKDIVEKIHIIFVKGEDDNIKENIQNEIEKYLKSSYQKQLLESMDFKILVKDTTLINGIKEQGERYLFTNNNSRIFELVE